jgi:membrane dipeptidase
LQLATSAGVVATTVGCRRGHDASAGEPGDASRRLHERLLTLDSHLDTPANFASPGWDIMRRHDVRVDLSQVDYPRMVSGGLDGGFWAIYTAQGPRTPEGEAALPRAAMAGASSARSAISKRRG